MSNDPSFDNERKDILDFFSTSDEAKSITYNWLSFAQANKYSYQFDWMSRPIIQYPQDIVAMQDLIWKVKPDLIIETGIARGGSLVYYASLLALLDMSEAIEKGEKLDPSVSNRKVLGIDIDIRPHNKDEILKHPMSSRIHMIQGSSIEPGIISKVKEFSSNYKNILVLLDSNHTHDHVLDELNAYAELTTIGSYCVVFDTLVEGLPEEQFNDRPWGNGNNPMTAVWEFLKNNNNFEIDNSIDKKIQITVAPDGYLKRIK